MKTVHWKPKWGLKVGTKSVAHVLRVFWQHEGVLATFRNLTAAPGRGMHVSPIELSDFENAAPDCCLLVRIRSRSRASSSNGLMPGDEERSFMSLRATEEEF